MSKRSIEKKDGHASILSYVFSTIFFDIIAYSVSIRLGNLVSARIGNLSSIPGTYLIPLIGPFEFYTYHAWNFALAESTQSFALAVLPMATFVWGVIFHHLLTKRKTNGRIRNDLNMPMDNIDN